MKHSVAALTLIALSTSAIAQKKPGPPPAANPELAYVDTRSKYPEVKLANADLTGAFGVFRSTAQYQMPSYDLAPRGQNQVAVTSGGAANLVSWDNNGSVVTIATQPLTAPGRAGRVSFSPDGTRIAVFYETDTTIRIFDTPTQQVVAEWPSGWLMSMTYYGDGSKIAFFRYGVPTIFILDVNTGDTEEYPFTLVSLEHLGDGHGSGALLVTYRTPGGAPEDLYFGRWESGQMVEQRISQGWDAKYNCSETRIVYRSVGNAPPTYVHNLETGLSSLLTKNTDVRRVDYVPTC
jgi:WD40 repeat protein